MAIDKELAEHCLHPSHLGKESHYCPVVRLASTVRTPHPACEGWSQLDTMKGWLDLALVESQQADAGKKFVARRLGQAEALAAAIALLEDPYNPDPNAVREEATRRIES